VFAIQTGADYPLMTHKLYYGLLLSIILAAIGYFAGVVLSDPTTTLAAVRHLSAPAWCGILGLSLLNYTLRYLRWDGGIRLLTARRLPHLMHAISYVAGFAFTTTPGKAGEAFRCVLLKREGIGHDASLAVLVYERVLDLATMLVLASLALFAFPRYDWLLMVTVGILAVFLASLHGGLLTSICNGLSQRFGGRIGRLLHHIGHLLAQTRALLGWRPLLGGLLVGIAAWGSEGVGLYLILHAFGLNVSLSLAVGVYALGMLAGAFSIVPGGIGGAEAMMTLCLKLLGVPLGMAVAATLVCRVATLWFAMLLGLIACAKVAARPGREPALIKVEGK
jgi:uncharacterized protein (TIRG00374 family)